MQRFGVFSVFIAGVIFRDFAAKIARTRLAICFNARKVPNLTFPATRLLFLLPFPWTSKQVAASTIDSAFLFAGALTVGTYFDRETPRTTFNAR
jgi:hypothetical protein